MTWRAASSAPVSSVGAPRLAGLRRQAQELDVGDLDAGVAQRAPGLAQLGAVRERIAGAVGGDLQEPQADPVKPGFRHRPDRRRRCEINCRQMRDAQLAAHALSSAASRPAMKPKVIAGPRLMPPAG